jgi:hypothetical protein
LQATITLEYDNAKIASSIAKAVCPDNYKVPKGLNIKTQQDGKKVSTEIHVDKKITTLIATIDDLLESASTAEKTLRIAEK